MSITPDATPPLLHVTGLDKSFTWGHQTIEILKGINLEVRQGEFLTMVGASGAGKSTLLHILGTLDRPTRGTVLYDNQDMFRLSEHELAHFRNRHIGFVFQFHHLLPEFTALENTCFPGFIQKRPVRQCTDEARELLSEVGLEHRLHHKPGELSGGEQQRVAVARALIQNPDLVLADEPTGNVDSRTGEILFQLLRTFNEQRGTAFIIVTHNEHLAQQSDRLVYMADGRITDSGNGVAGQDGSRAR